MRRSRYLMLALLAVALAACGGGGSTTSTSSDSQAATAIATAASAFEDAASNSTAPQSRCAAILDDQRAQCVSDLSGVSNDASAAMKRLSESFLVASLDGACFDTASMMVKGSVAVSRALDAFLQAVMDDQLVAMSDAELTDARDAFVADRRSFLSACVR